MFCPVTAAYVLLPVSRFVPCPVLRFDFAARLARGTPWEGVGVPSGEGTRYTPLRAWRDQVNVAQVVRYRLADPKCPGVTDSSRERLSDVLPATTRTGFYLVWEVVNPTPSNGGFTRSSRSAEALAIDGR
jgi:hypothetical protein